MKKTQTVQNIFLASWLHNNTWWAFILAKKYFSRRCYIFISILLDLSGLWLLVLFGNNILIMAVSYPEVSLPADAKVQYIDTAQDCVYYASKLLRDAHGNENKWSAWAFDLEWTVEFKAGEPQHPVGMMQFCRDNVILLFHIAKCGLPNELAQVLYSPHIFKLGVNIAGDKAKLKRDFPHLFVQPDADVGGCVDSRDLASFAANVTSNADPAHRIEGVIFTPEVARSLAGLVKQFMKVELPKPSDVRISNWDVSLSEEQKRYAAMDVYVSYVLYKQFMMSVMQVRGSELNMLPMRILQKMSGHGTQHPIPQRSHQDDNVLPMNNSDFVDSFLSSNVTMQALRSVSLQSPSRRGVDVGIKRIVSEPPSAVTTGTSTGTTINPCSAVSVPKNTRTSSETRPSVVSITMTPRDIASLETALESELVQRMIRTVTETHLVNEQPVSGSFLNVKHGLLYDPMPPGGLKPESLSSTERITFDLFTASNQIFSRASIGASSAPARAEILKSIAERRRIKYETVCNYLLRAVQQKWPYDIRKFELSRDLLTAVFEARLLWAFLTKERNFSETSRATSSANANDASKGSATATVSATQIIEYIMALREHRSSKGSCECPSGPSDAVEGEYATGDDNDKMLRTPPKKKFVSTSANADGILHQVIITPPTRSANDGSNKFSSTVTSTDRDNLSELTPLPWQDDMHSGSNAVPSSSSMVHDAVLSTDKPEYWQVRLASLHTTRLFGDNWEQLLVRRICGGDEVDNSTCGVTAAAAGTCSGSSEGFVVVCKESIANPEDADDPLDAAYYLA
jgi:hypothetical protein